MPDSVLIKKFLEGTATEAEIKQMLEYLADEHADLTELRAYADGLWNPRQSTLIPAEKDEELLQQLRERLYPGHKEEQPARVRRIKRPLIWAAAALIPIALLVTLFLQREKAQQEPQQAWQRWTNTGNGMDRRQLPDGTMVWLASHSSLAYMEDPDNGHRELLLEGEAFFDVRRDDKHPFVLTTGMIHTTVLGTSFNVEAYPNESDVRVSLVSGKVKMEGPDRKPGMHEELLAPGQSVAWQSDGSNVKKDSFKMENKEEWTKGYMIFNDVLLKDALQRITMRYNLRLQFAPGIAEEHRRITTVFKDDAIDEMLHVLPFITPYRYVIRDQVLLVDKK